MSSRSCALFAAVCLASSISASAHAYCRTHSGDPGQSTCPPECPNTGNPLAWRTSHMSYGFNVREFPGLSDAQLRQTFEKSFATWAAVMCDGESIGFHFTQLPGTTTLEQGPMNQEPNENVVTHYDPAAWAQLGYTSHAFAITAVWFASSGQIFGADIGVNGGMDLYGDCAVDTCSSSGPLRTDLQNVATHEIGHFLGLSHSAVAQSTMSCEAQAGDTNKRTLETDDIDGICASYPPGTSFPDDHNGGGCAVGGPGRGAWSLGTLGVLAGWFVRRRKKR